MSDDADLPACVFPTVARFATVFSDRNRAMLRFIIENKPSTMHEIAYALDYPHASLTRAIAALEEHGVIALKQGARQARVPVVLHKQVVLHVPLQKGVTGKMLTLFLGPDRPKGRGSKGRFLVSIDELSAAIPGKNGLQVLRLIGECQPYTVAELGRRAGKAAPHHYSHALVKRFVAFGLVKFAQPDNKQPVLVFDAITLDLKL